MANGETIESENKADEWEELAKKADSFEKAQKAFAPERMKGFYRNILGYQRSFEKRSDTLASAGEKMSQKEFETWEDLEGNELKLVNREIEKGGFSLEETADGEQYMITSGADKEIKGTIEAQSGRFYHQRIGDLRDAIRETGGNEEDLEFLNEFYPMVVKHLDFKYMSLTDVIDYGYEAYDRRRTESHNAVIRHLNGLNALARKYQVRPLTVRDFWASDVRREEDQTPAVARVLKYDRKVVEAYYEVAFSSEAKRRASKLERDSKWGIR